MRNSIGQSVRTPVLMLRVSLGRQFSLLYCELAPSNPGMGLKTGSDWVQCAVTWAAMSDRVEVCRVGSRLSKENGA